MTLLLLLAVTAAATLAAHSVVADQERRLLRERGAEAGQLLRGLAASIGARLTTVSAVTAAASNPSEKFSRVAPDAVSPTGFAYLALLDAGPSAVRVERALGDGPRPGSALTAAGAMSAVRAARAAATEEVVPTAVRTVDGRPRIGWATAVPHGAGLVVYAETVLSPFAAADRRSAQADQLFSELDGALYASTAAVPDQVVLATTRRLPLHGEVYRTTVSVGPARWLLAVQARESLTGSLAQNMPMVFLGAGLLLALLATAVVEVLLRRRGYALALVDERTAALQTSLAELEEAQSRFRLAFDAAPVGMCLVGPGGEFLQVNPSLCRVLGVPASTLLTLSLQDFVHHEDWSEGTDVAGFLGSGEPVQRRYLHADGDVVWGRLVSSEVGDETGALRYYVVQIEDVTEARRSESALTYQALHDTLTGLPNRALFTERIAGALARRSRRPAELAVLFLDLDGFKLINDGLGHEAGDRVLTEIGRRLCAAVRPGDTVARFGGDEFVVLCEEIAGVAEAEGVANRMATAIGHPIPFAGQELSVTASVGIVVTNAGQHSPAELLRDADTAMYRAKQRGKARHEIFDERLRRRALNRVRDESDLRRALRDGALEVHYQPLVELATDRIAGLEALLRYNDPDRGLVLPPDFITVAEESGLIAPLGSWVLQRACADMAEGLRGNRPYGRQIMINVSARQAARADFLDTVTAALDAATLPPDALCLELTETALMEASHSTMRTLRRLRDLGVELGIDDFGTGYSSLTYVKRLPVSFLKVDRSFVAGIADDAEDRAIVTAIVRLGQALGLRTVAEGIEDASQLAAVRDLGCDLGQGYFLGRPYALGDEQPGLPAPRREQSATRPAGAGAALGLD